MRPVRVHPAWLVGGIAAVVVAAVAGVAVGAVGLPPGRVLLAVLDHVPGVHVHSGLSVQQSAIVWQLRVPRVVLALLVGSMLSSAGAAYQGVFRNPLAEPFLLGAASGAALGATLAIVWGTGGIPFAAFVGAAGAVALAYGIAQGAGGRSPAILLLAGVAVAYFLQAIQAYEMARHAERIRQIYSFLMGSFTSASWGDVRSVLPFAVLSTVVLVVMRRSLDVLAVGDDEAAALGLRVNRTRLVVVLAATLATAAAVSVSGVILFVGLIVPHAIRLVAGASYRVILPLSFVFGAAFLTAADVLARSLASPAEIPIGVITAFFGAPFFVWVLLQRRRPTL